MLPVVRELSAAGAVVSIDTMRSVVAAEALAVGAQLINDVSGGRADPAIMSLAAERDLPYVCMHWRGHSEDMQSRADYVDVVADVSRELAEQLAAAERADRSLP